MSYISASLRKQVTDRAESKCEYCQFPQALSFFTFEMEHVISEKHDGETVLDNLALACPPCNRAKGSDLGSIDPITRKLTPFFHPRLQQWSNHFRFERASIVPLTAEGRVTTKILQFNSPDRISERDYLM
jgi:5-methylcytosine-specific restriction endonuclease McrA